MKITLEVIEDLCARFKEVHNIDAAFIAVDGEHSVMLEDIKTPAPLAEMLEGVTYKFCEVKGLPRIVLSKGGLDANVLISNSLPAVVYKNLPLDKHERLMHATL